MKKLLLIALVVFACSGNGAQDKQKPKTQTEREWIEAMKLAGQMRFEVTHIFDANTGFIVVCDRQNDREYILPFKGGIISPGFRCEKK